MNPAHEEFAAGAEMQGLECQIGRFRVVVPTPYVNSVIELDLSPPPPLCSKWIGGLAYHDGRAIACLSLSRPSTKYPTRRLAKGILLSADASIPLLLEVDVVRSFRSVKVLTRKAAAPGQATPAWVNPAADTSGQTVALIDVMKMVRELVGD